MVPIQDTGRTKGYAFVTYTLFFLLVVIYLWDREWQIFGPRIVFSDLAARPRDVISALEGGDKFPLVTLLTSAFLHANLPHIIFNLIFLAVFAPRVEDYFGGIKFMLYYLFWGVSAAMIQIWVNPSSGVPMLGSSGAIAVVMGAYLLLYPASRIRVLIMPIFLSVEFRAWFLLSFWFLMQIFLVQPGVANWAHAGGFLIGMLIVILFRKKPQKLNKNVRAGYL